MQKRLILVSLALTAALVTTTGFANHLNKQDLNQHYSSLEANAKAKGLSPKVLNLGLRAFENARLKGMDRNKKLLTIIDYSKPSTEKRFWVIDLKTNKILFTELVAHAKNSGGNMATSFSNRNGSKKSSLGVFLTGRTYYGKNGLSLKLKGLEKGVNNNAYRRNVVIHGANYVSSSFAKRFGRLGRSWGCPALSKKDYIPVINKIKKGTIVFTYYPKTKYVDNSKYLRA